MARRSIVALFMLLFAPVIFAQTQFVLVKSALTYHMSHPIHHIDGTSTEAKGKGSCGGAKCDFRIAAPVNSFR